MTDETEMTPIDTGVLAALMLVGKAVAQIPGIDIDELKADAARVAGALPSEPTDKSGGSVHAAGINALLRGIDRVKAPQK